MAKVIDKQLTTRSWLFRKKVIVSSRWITEVNWDESMVRLILAVISFWEKISISVVNVSRTLDRPQQKPAEIQGHEIARDTGQRNPPNDRRHILAP